MSRQTFTRAKTAAAMKDADAGKVVDGKFILPSGNGMTASCHHQRKGACGGCYARMAVLMDDIEADPLDAVHHIKRASAAMKAEKP